MERPSLRLKRGGEMWKSDAWKSDAWKSDAWKSDAWKSDAWKRGGPRGRDHLGNDPVEMPTTRRRGGHAEKRLRPLPPWLIADSQIAND
jgi:hypothetical protein